MIASAEVAAHQIAQHVGEQKRHNAERRIHPVLCLYGSIGAAFFATLTSSLLPSGLDAVSSGVIVTRRPGLSGFN